MIVAEQRKQFNVKRKGQGCPDTRSCQNMLCCRENSIPQPLEPFASKAPTSTPSHQRSCCRQRFQSHLLGAPEQTSKKQAARPFVSRCASKEFCTFSETRTDRNGPQLRQGDHTTSGCLLSRRSRPKFTNYIICQTCPHSVLPSSTYRAIERNRLQD
jgi:hypothetical protein